MAFTTIFSETSNNDVIPEGKYEVIVKKAEESVTNGGKPYLNFWFVVRNDVEQNFRNRYIFYRIWKKKETTQDDLQVDGYSFKQLMNLAKSADLPNGKHYETVADLCRDFTNRCVLITLKHKEYNGQLQEKVKYISETRHNQCRHVWNKNSVVSDKVSGNSGQNFVESNKNNLGDFEEILSDEEVPF